jgi:ABC-type iron transport system FetAB permease component
MALLLQVITSRDVQSLALACVLFVGLAAAALVFRRRLGVLLTAREWRVFFKLVAIIVMALLLVFTSIAVEFPAEKFIYGRF